MGREIRRVPADWEHPRQQCKHSPWTGGCHEAKANGGRCFMPLHNRDYDTEAREWIAAAEKWHRGEPDEHSRAEDMAEHPFYWDWSGPPPDKDYYRPKWTDAECTHFQVYETVSEGTPVTPHFATKAELVDYLVAHGDFWDQHRGEGGWSRKAAEQFVGSEWAPSLLVKHSAEGAHVFAPRDGRPAQEGQ